MMFLQYLSAPSDKLTQRTYNVTGYSFTPEEIAAAIRKVMPNFEIEYEVCPIRQKIGSSTHFYGKDTVIFEMAKLHKVVNRWFLSLRAFFHYLQNDLVTGLTGKNSK